MLSSPAITLAHDLAERMGALPQVEAVALGGSRASGATDAASDIDIYVYTRGDLPLADRRAVVDQLGGATRASLSLTFWGPGDEWIHAPSGLEIDLVYFDADWMAAELRRVIQDHRASLGYSTCFWHTVRTSQPLHDPSGWYAALQAESRAPYPEPLRRNIVALNHPVLRDVIPSYYSQVEKAADRGDLVSVNHRLAALLASYFDILFAVNRVLHPGEKRLLERAEVLCATRPAALADDITAVLQAAGAANGGLLAHLTRLLDRLDTWLAARGAILDAPAATGEAT